MKNLFADMPTLAAGGEQVAALLETGALKIERIVSQNYRTPPGEWCEQAREEWVVLLRGSAGLRFEDEPEVRLLQPGSHVRIAAHRRHRVEWTDPAQPTVWLAMHFRAPARREPAKKRRAPKGGGRRR